MNGNDEEAQFILEKLNYNDSDKLNLIVTAGSLFEDNNYKDVVDTLAKVGISTTINYINSDTSLTKEREVIKSIKDITFVAVKANYEFNNWNYCGYKINYNNGEFSSK